MSARCRRIGAPPYREPVPAAGVSSPPLIVERSTDGEASSTEKPPSRGRELTPGLRTEAAVAGETVVVLNHFFLTGGKDTLNITEDRDMTFTSAARFLILDQTSRLALGCLTADLCPACCCAVLAPGCLSHGEDPAFDPQPGWEDCDSRYASRMQRFGECGLLTGFCRGFSWALRG
jgi:hypothetical protein